MAKKPTILTIGSGYNSSQAVNTSLERLRDAFDNTLSLDGSSPNAMSADLDMNGNDILNVGSIFVDDILIGDGEAADLEGFLAAAQASADAAAASAAQAEAAVANLEDAAIPTFIGRSEANAATVDVSVNYIRVIHDSSVYYYVRDASGTALTTNAASVNWSPVSPYATPGHWGANMNVDVDQATAIQACFDWTKGRRNALTEQFEYVMDGQNKNYVVKTSLDFGGVRQPDLKVRNLHLFGSITNKIIIDATHSNQMIWENCVVVGDEDNQPFSGWHIGRNDTGAIAPNHKFNHCRTKGAFRYAAIFNNGSEAWTTTACYWENNSQQTDSYSVVICGHGASRLSNFPLYSSDYYSWYTGSQSCISHNLAYCQIARPSRSTLTITGITKAASAVVTVNPTDLANSHFIVGSPVYFHDLQGMTELNDQWGTITAINAGTGQITININTTGYGTFTSGRLWTRTGPGLFLNAVKNVKMDGNYILTYGNNSVRIDLTEGSCSGIDLTFQNEASPDQVIRFDVDSANEVQDFRLCLRNVSQNIGKSVFITSGSGTVTFEHLDLIISNEGGADSFNATLFQPRNDFLVYDAKLVVPDRTAADYDGSDTLPDVFYGTVYAYDDKATILHGGQRFSPKALLSTNANTLDDYEEGTWTPELRVNNSASGISYSIRDGSYQKVGNTVTATFRLDLTSKGAGSGDVTIHDLPFLVANESHNFNNAGAISNYSNCSSVNGLTCFAPEAGTYIEVRVPGAASSPQLTSSQITNTTVLHGFVIYRTDA
jgi:hypothetical protein